MCLEIYLNVTECMDCSESSVGWMTVLPTKRAVQGLRAIPPVLDGFSAALQGQLQGGYPLLHLRLTVCSQEVAVTVLHLQLKTIAAHLWALKKDLDTFDKLL